MILHAAILGVSWWDSSKVLSDVSKPACCGKATTTSWIYKWGTVVRPAQPLKSWARSLQIAARPRPPTHSPMLTSSSKPAYAPEIITSCSGIAAELPLLCPIMQALVAHQAMKRSMYDAPCCLFDHVCDLAVHSACKCLTWMPHLASCYSRRQSFTGEIKWSNPNLYHCTRQHCHVTVIEPWKMIFLLWGLVHAP